MTTLFIFINRNTKKTALAVSCCEKHAREKIKFPDLYETADSYHVAFLEDTPIILNLEEIINQYTKTKQHENII